MEDGRIMTTPTNPILAPKALPAELTRAIEDFKARSAWGSIQIDFNKGRIVLVRKNETIQTPEHQQLTRRDTFSNDYSTR